MGFQMNDIANLSQKTNEQLKNELAECLTLSAKQLNKAALLFVELESRGVDLSELKSGMGYYLPAIGSGKLDAGIVIKYADRKDILNQVIKLSIDDQLKLLKCDKIEVVRSRAGSFYSEKISISKLRPIEINRIFSLTKIKTPEEQLLTYQPTAKPKKVKKKKRAPIAVRKFEIDKENEGIKVGNLFVKADSMIEQIAKYYDVDKAKLKSFISHR